MRVRIGELTSIRTGKLDANASSLDGEYPFFTCSREPLRISTYSYDCECVLVAGNGDMNVKYYNGKFDAYQRTYIIENNSSGKLYMPYLYFFMLSYIEELRKQAIGGVIKYIKLGNLTEAQIELPTIEEQKKIVQILESADSIIKREERQQDCFNDLIKARFVEMFGDPVRNTKMWHTEKLYVIAPINKYKGNVDVIDGKVWLLNLDMIESCTGNILGILYEYKNRITSSTIKFDENCVLYSKLRPYLNKVVIPKMRGYATSELISMSAENINKYFLANLLRQDSFVDFSNSTSYGAKMPRASMDTIKNFDVIMPPIELQNQFAAFVEQVNKSKVEVKKALDEAQLLFDSLMQKYFG